MTKWEYRVYRLNPRKLLDDLNALGNDGWEVVHIIDPPETGLSATGLFKRPRSLIVEVKA